MVKSARRDDNSVRRPTSDDAGNGSEPSGRYAACRVDYTPSYWSFRLPGSGNARYVSRRSILKAAFYIAVSPAAEAIVTELGAPWSSCEPSPSRAAAFSVAGIIPPKKRPQSLGRRTAASGLCSIRVQYCQNLMAVSISGFRELELRLLLLPQRMRLEPCHRAPFLPVPPYKDGELSHNARHQLWAIAAQGN